MNWWIARLKEPSTWRGLVWLLTFAGLSLKPEQSEAIIAAGIALAGLLGVLTHDKTVDLPPIELQGRADSPAPDSTIAPPTVGFQRYRDRDDDGMQPELPTRSEPEQSTGWNG